MASTEGKGFARQTARDMLVDELRHEILSGNLAPGERLVAPDVAARFGVSQTPAREAIHLLESEGLVINSPYKGARVAEMDPDECEEIFLMREALEHLAARLAAGRIDEATIGAMQRELDRMSTAAKANDLDAFLEADRTFHRLHFDASGRPRLVERIMGLRSSGERYIRLAYQSSGEMERALPSYAVLMTHLREHDKKRTGDWYASVLLRVPFRVRRILCADGPDGVPGSSLAESL